MRFALRRPEFWPSFFTVIGVGTMLALGFWQLERLEWKEHLMARMDAAQVAPIVTQLPKDDKAFAALEYQRVAVKGSFVPGKYLLISGRYYKNQMGEKLIALFKLAGGGEVIVDRGWIPKDKKTGADIAAFIPRRAVTLHGLVREGDHPRAFLPGNDPAKDMWLWKDIDAMSEALGTAPRPMMLEEVGEKTDVYPIPSEGLVIIRNNHFGYAITWFAIAAAGFLIYLLYHRKK